MDSISRVRETRRRHRSWRLRGSVTILASFLAVNAFAQETSSLSEDTLAVIGPRAITTSRFSELYGEKMLKLGLPDNYDSRGMYLSNLVDNEAFIAEAKRRGLDRTAKANAELSRLQTQELLNAYSVMHISPRLQVSDEALRKLFADLHKKVKVRHLYARTKREADALYDHVRNGRRFEELAESTFTDPRLKHNGGLLGYIAVDEMDRAFERAAFSMKPGEVSRPIKTVEGYSIIKVEDIRQDPLVTETEFLRSRENLSRFARKRKYEELTSQYATTLRLQTGLRFDSALVTRLYMLVPKEPSPGTLTETSSALTSSEMKSAIALSKRGNWSTRRLIDTLSRSVEKQRRWIHSRENFEDYLAGIIMRTSITEDARREKLDTTKAFREKVEYAFDTYLLTTFEEQLKGQIRISPDSARSFYQNNRERFATPRQVRLSGILVEDAIMADSVRRLLAANMPFEQAARRFSVQTNTAPDGGDMGFLGENDLGGQADQIFAMKTGEWRGPLAGEGRYLFVKCTGKKPAAYRSFEDVSPEIQKTLLNIAWETERTRQAASLRKASPCRIYPDKLLSIHPLSMKR